MASLAQDLRRATDRFAGLPSPAVFGVFWLTIALSHLTLLRLPYYWDEGGYYIPAALDFYHRCALIPEYTNAHPPLPNVVLGLLWHLTGYGILPTRLLVCGFAAAGLLAVFRLAQRLLGAGPALVATLLTALYPIWFAQSTLAHADIFAAAFTLWAFALYLIAVSDTPSDAAATASTSRTHFWMAILFSLAALAKETAIIEPAALAALHLALLWRTRDDANATKESLRWLRTFAVPFAVLLAWFGYHRLRTGFTFGNPEYLRYNATANLSVGHILTAVRYRFIHLFWQRNIWVPLLFAAICLLLLPRARRLTILPSAVLRTIVVLLAANWLAFSVLGGALLTRYLLPVYPLLLLLCVATWRAATKYWPAFGALTAAAFFVGLWWNPPAAFAPEDNLTYRDMIVLHQQAIGFIDSQYPDARVLTSWPAAAELFRPDLGYTDRRIRVEPIDNFSSTEIAKAGQTPGGFDTALVFSKNFFPPTLTRYLLAHPDTSRGRDFQLHRDLTANEIAARLHGTIVFQSSAPSGEWVAVLRFSRSYEARRQPPVEALGINSLR